MAYTMPSCVYMSITARIVISHNIDINDLFDVMQKITKYLTKSGNIPPLRFAKYYLFEKELTMKEKNYWKDGVSKISTEIDRINKLNKIDGNDYKRLHTIVKKLPQIGNLRANHVCAIASIIGIIPLSMFHYIIGGSTKGIELLEN